MTAAHPYTSPGAVVSSASGVTEPPVWSPPPAAPVTGPAGGSGTPAGPDAPHVPDAVRSAARQAVAEDPDGAAGMLAELAYADRLREQATTEAVSEAVARRLAEMDAVVQAHYADTLGRIGEAGARTIAKLERAVLDANHHDGTTPVPGAAPDTASSWALTDLSAYADGTHAPERPTLLTRADGESLIYPGKVHSLHGESESGKSWVAQYVAACELRAGRPVLFLDFESDPASVVDRLRTLGVPPDAIAERFGYLTPDTNPHRSPADAAALADTLAAHPYTLAVVDGVTAAMVMYGAESVNNDDVTRWIKTFPEMIAKTTGAAVVVVDHVTKDANTRGRFAIGGQSKMAGLSGAAYVVEPRKPLGRGMVGEVVLRVGKDRPGYVRGVSGAYRAGDRTQEAARLVFDAAARNGRMLVTVTAPEATTGDAEPEPFRPTTIMEHLSRQLESAPGPQTFNDVTSASQYGDRKVRAALNILIADGFVAVENGPRGSQLHTVARAYRQADDPKSDSYRPDDSHRPQTTVTVVGSIDPNDGRQSNTVVTTTDDDGQRQTTVKAPTGKRSGVRTNARPVSDAAIPHPFRGFDPDTEN